MRIANNLSAITAFNSLNFTNEALSKTINALSTGLRINSASDDAAGFAVSEKMRSQIRGLETALRNSQDGISLLQTAEGALGQTNSMLQRMRELTVQASNDSLTSQDRSYIQLEINQLKDQIDRIANTTQFNNKRILDGSSGALWSSNDPGLKARINGGLTYTDNFGQKVSSEGNYRIEIKAEAGDAQVQKSNIINTTASKMYSKDAQTQVERKIIGWEEETIVEDRMMQWSIAIDGGDNGEAVSTIKEAPNADEINSGWSYDTSSRVLTISESGTYHIVGKSTPTQNRIVIAPGVNANIFLEDVNIDVSRINNACAFQISTGASANVYLKGTNKLNSESERAGLEVPKGASLTLGSAEGYGSTRGYLTATSEHSGRRYGGGAGIGGPGSYVSDGAAGSITINGGTIKAYGNLGGAGIGGGNSNGIDNATIVINGGDITAYGGASHSTENLAGGAGIGSGYAAREDSTIDIKGGIIKAYGGGIDTDPLADSGVSSGAGIGGGGASKSGVIRISNALRDSIIAVPGDSHSEAIGHGFGGSVSNVSYIDFPSETPDPVPEMPEVLVKTPAVVRKPIYDETIQGEYILHTLREIPTFYNSEGVFMFTQPKHLTIIQGDGQTADITLYETDTMYDVAEKINNVIANIFGNSKYTDNPNKFCTIADGTNLTSESAYDTELIYEYEPLYDEEQNVISYTKRETGYNINTTMLIRSAKPGKEGELFFSGDDELLNALGLNTIHESSESRFTASVYNAHSGTQLATGIKATGNVLTGIIPNVDIEFDAMAGIKSSWDENTKRYFFTDDETYSATLHLRDNGIIFQTGANKGEDFTLQLGDTSCSSLGIVGVNVASRNNASHSIGVIDRAINRISSQRAKIGAFINGLEHTMTNLTTTTANLTAAESRIRDADMSKTMMEFVKLQVLNQSGTSMLAQANQLPRSVLNLIGG